MTPRSRSASEKLRIIVGGLVGQFPLGGVAWDYFHYLLGLHELGHEVYYYEDTWVWPFNPVERSATDNPQYTLQFFHDFFSAHARDLADKWHYILLHDKRYGMSADAFDRVAASADIFLNVSGACFFPEKLSPHCVKV
ncbi:MAG: glycosyltransferase family 1 protein, partial [Tepidisphaeraceae bacterium]